MVGIENQRAHGPRVAQDVLVSASLIVFCAVALYLTAGFREVPASLSQNVPPTFFPRIVLGAIMVLSVMLALSRAGRTIRPRERVPRDVFGTSAILAGAVALVPYVGMLVAVFVVAVALPLFWGERRQRRLAVFAVTLPVAIYVLFALVLGMRFPWGVLA